ncbi:MAG TPA: hypothetical protein VGJ21_11475, partial [Terracidiphilus sp.]
IQYGFQQGYNPLTAAAYASQAYAPQFGQQRDFGQQGLFGGAGGPLNGLMGSGMPGLFGGQNYGRHAGQQGGQVTDGFGGMFQAYGNPYGNNMDPLTAAQIQQSQWGQHNQFGLPTHLAQQAQLAQQQAQLAQLVQQSQVAQQLAQQQLGRSPYGFDPASAAIAQQRAQFGQNFGQQAQLAPWLGVNPLNRLDPLTAAYIQQAQIAQLLQQLALQGQQGQFGQQFGQGQGQGQGWFGAQNPWVTQQLANQYGRTPSLPYGGPLPIY